LKVLLTGFDRFGEHDFNPSERLVRAMAARGLVDFVCEILPTEYKRADSIIRERIRALRPDILLGTGVAATRPTLCLERVALNIDDAEIADNRGVLRSGSSIEPRGPLALETGCALPPIADRLRIAGIAVAISTHAGTFLCNHVYYAALAELKRHQIAGKCLFLHLPMRAEIGEFVAALDLVLEELARQQTPAS